MLSNREELLRVAVEVGAAEEIADVTELVRSGNQAILFPESLATEFRSLRISWEASDESVWRWELTA